MRHVLLSKWSIRAFGLIGLAAACSDDGGTETGDGGGDAFAPVTTLIGPEGGTLVSDDGLLTLEVPPGALAEEVALSAVRSGLLSIPTIVDFPVAPGL